MLRRRTQVGLSFALAVLFFASRFANAEDVGPRPPAAPAASASPPPPPPPETSPQDRPALVPATPRPMPYPEPGPSAPVVISPAHDQQELAGQGSQRPVGGELAAGAREVFSDDWWGRARPIVELHGYFRTRAELFHNFFLGRHSSTLQGNDSKYYLFPIPIDQSYTQVSGTQGQTVSVCGSATSNNKTASGPCYNKTEAGANLRLRLDPEVHISDNLRILTQVDLLDNLVLGSTPDAYAMQPASAATAAPPGGQTTPTSGGKATYPTGYQPAGVNGYAPVGFLSTTQGPPTAGVNAWTNSINIKRVWGEYMTPVGQLRFGRMPGHWGLGMVENSGDGIDSDYQTTLDRVMFITGIKSIDLYFGAAWDFISSGPNSANAYSVYGGQPYPTCNSCGVNQWAAFIAHRMTPELQRHALSRGDVVVNGGLYATFRAQNIDVVPGQTPQTADYTSVTPPLEARQAWMLTPDLWLQLLWQKLRVEAEAATMQGQIGYMTGVNADATNPIRVQQYGVVTQTEYRAIDDKLNLQFGFGWASGDPWTSTLTAPNGLRPELNSTGPIATFQFHPDYRVDLIFYRHILSRVQGSYYFRPSVSYDFVRHADGERLGGGATIIWSRASEFVQAPAHARDLGVELNAQLYYQSKDGSLNDEPGKFGGFYTMLQYGVFFPLAGLEYLPGDVTQGFDASLSAAQTVRLFLGIIF